ncbi:uncharacterized protein DS421_15g502450 [Arachis hypogaea]|nr:uncharacterized protein DS421_15g502450 [Arachis hypogaea]
MEKEKLPRAQHSGAENFDGGDHSWKKSVDGGDCCQKRMSRMRSQISRCDRVSCWFSHCDGVSID